MPSSTLRRSPAGVLLPPQYYPFAMQPWSHFPREVDWTAGAGISLAAGASNVLSAWTDLFASTAADCDAILLSFVGTGVNNASSTSLLSISTGTAGNETTSVIVAEAQVGTTGDGGSGLGSKQYLFPVRVAAGTRLSFAVQSAHATPPTGVYRATLLKLPFGQSPPKLDAYGATTATSTGVAVTADATWTQVTASTTNAYQALVFTYGSVDTGFGGGTSATLSLGIGAAAAEVEIMRMPLTTTSGERQVPTNTSFGMLAAVPTMTGTRIAVKGTNATAETFNAVVFGVPYG